MPVEGYHVLIGGGFGPQAALGRELYRDVKAQDAPQTVERILKAYLAHRASREESFIAFARRHEIDALKAMAERRPPHEHHAAPADPVLHSGDPRRSRRSSAPGSTACSPACSGWKRGVTPLSPADVAKLLPGLLDVAG